MGFLVVILIIWMIQSLFKAPYIIRNRQMSTKPISWIVLSWIKKNIYRQAFIKYDNIFMENKIHLSAY